MKMVKSLILGSAAGLLAMSGAQAADLPVKAKAVEYVRICSLYGAGFWYIPGTDTCMKIGGYLRVDTTFNGSDLRSAGVVGRPRPAATATATTSLPVPVWRSRSIPAPPPNTAWSAPSVRLTSSSRPRATTRPTRPRSRHRRSAGTNPACSNQPGEGYVAVEFVFIQFAGFTFGKSASAYATPWHGYPGNNSSFLLGGHDTVTGVNNIQYTAQFGNGVSATIGLDDPTVFNRTSVANLTPRYGLRPAASSTPTAACTILISSATSASIRPGVCSRFRARCMKSTPPTTC